ncbi:DUF2325 domain-containing protein [Thermodesulfovibrionales bacterium]|nr:DUF2325 domain-containing protein [Thermodesulfovibrionales bacterium]
MCIALIGGMCRLERQYINEAEKFGFGLKVFTKPETGLKGKVKNVDAMVIITNKVSHRTKKDAMTIAKDRKIPVFLYHSCGICTLRNCFSDLKVARPA